MDSALRHDGFTLDDLRDAVVELERQNPPEHPGEYWIMLTSWMKVDGKRRLWLEAYGAADTSDAWLAPDRVFGQRWDVERVETDAPIAIHSIVVLRADREVSVTRLAWWGWCVELAPSDHP
jgi:hypothetical protein